MEQTADHLTTVGCRVLWLGGPEQSPPRSSRGLLVDGEQKSSSSSMLGDSEGRTLPQIRCASSFVEGRGDPRPDERDDCSIRQPLPAPTGSNPTSRGTGSSTSESEAEIPCHTVPGDCQRLNDEGMDQTRSRYTPTEGETQGASSTSTRSVLDVPEAMSGRITGLSGVVPDSSELLLRYGVCPCLLHRQGHFRA